MNDPQFLTVAQLTEKHQAFTEGSLRWLLFNREHNGLAIAVVQIGRKVLIDEQAFVTWLRSRKAA